mmetsp:Transcript_53455/g.100591  ORF Transcript_53455/g.100591 Transcript_53455/m.100591 type:complete len:105 (+) Transcript_53455:60-374(+)
MHGLQADALFLRNTHRGVCLDVSATEWTSRHSQRTTTTENKVHAGLQDNLTILSLADAALCPVLQLGVHIAQCFRQLLLQDVQVICAQQRQLAWQSTTPLEITS